VTSSYDGGVYPERHPDRDRRDVGDTATRLVREAEIRPFVDFTRLHHVLVVLNEPVEDLPPLQTPDDDDFIAPDVDPTLDPEVFENREDDEDDEDEGDGDDEDDGTTTDAPHRRDVPAAGHRRAGRDGAVPLPRAGGLPAEPAAARRRRASRLADGAMSGLRVGFAAGLLTDLLVDQAPVGLAALVFTGVGYVIGLARPTWRPTR
jgi:hypothetical protein